MRLPPYQLHLRDGPVEGHFEVQHAPEVLRAVVAGDGTLDVLDAPEDCPRLDEVVHHYRRLGVAGHMCRRGGCMTLVDYVHAPGLITAQHGRDPRNAALRSR